MNPEQKEEKTLLNKREQWLSSLKLEGMEENLFELEILLKATERFFVLDNLPISNKDNVMARNFYYEVKILNPVVNRIVSLIRMLIDPEEVKAFYFKSYVEYKLIKDYTRDKLIENNLRQETPKESIFLLFNAFVNIQEILSGLSQLKKVPYTLYFNLGQLISREIYFNRYFNPFRLSAFSTLYDRITNTVLQSIVNSIKDEPVKKHFSVIILVFSRFIKYLKYINNSSEEIDVLKSSLPVFSLIHSESRSLWTYIDSDIPKELKSDKKHGKSGQAIRHNFLKFLDTLSFQINMEIKKTFQQILRDAAEIHSTGHLRTIIDNSKGVLNNFFQQSIVSISHLIKPDINGSDIFPDFVSRQEQSLRLREDVWILYQFVNKLDSALNAQNTNHILIKKEFGAFLDFMIYFKNLSYNLLRMSDLDDFNKFFGQIEEYSEDDLENSLKIEEIKKLLHLFSIFLSTTLSHINNRQELKNLGVDEEHAMQIMQEFLK